MAKKNGPLWTLLGGALVMAALVGVWVAPRYVGLPCRSKQNEAKGNLKSLYVSEAAFHAEHDRYDSDFAAVQFTPQGQRLRYVYTVLSATKEQFMAEARGVDDMLGDVWTIDHDKQLTHVENRCD